MNLEIAEEVVQDVFIQVWKNRQKISIEKSLSSYLFTSVKNRSINHIKSKYARLYFVDPDSSEPKLSHRATDDDIITTKTGGTFFCYTGPECQHLRDTNI